MTSNARKLAIALNPEETVDYVCFNRSCARFEKLTPVLVPDGQDDPKRRRGSRGDRLEVRPDPLFPLPTPERVDDGLTCYACGSSLSLAVDLS